MAYTFSSLSILQNKGHTNSQFLGYEIPKPVVSQTK